MNTAGAQIAARIAVLPQMRKGRSSPGSFWRRRTGGHEDEQVVEHVEEHVDHDEVGEAADDEHQVESRQEQDRDDGRAVLAVRPGEDLG